ncbi:hypothetical protein [Pedobacter sp.]
MNRKPYTNHLTIPICKSGGGLWFFARTHNPQMFYPFDRLYALKPKNPV